MEKNEYEMQVAMRRPVNYGKPWFLAAADALRSLRWQGGLALNLGCGNNEFSLILKNEFGASVWAADVVPSYVEKAAEMGFETFHVNIDSSDSRLQVQNLYAEKFDLIVLTHVVEHIFDTNGLFELAHHLLKFDGHLLISSPNASFIGNRIYCELQGGIPLGANNHHITFWSYPTLYTYYRCYGFTDIADYSRYFPERYTTQRLRFMIGQKLGTAFEKLYDFLGRFQHKKRFKFLTTNELVVVGKKTDARKFYFPFTFMDIDNMDKLEKEELLRRCAEMSERKVLKQHPGCYRRYLELGESLRE